MPNRVLIVDDNPLVAKVWGMRLAKAGYETRTATDGGMARAAVADWHPDVILLDVVLPDTDGLALCCEWRNDPQTRLTKIIVISAFASRKDIDAALAAGADGYIPKSSDTVSVLIDHVARCLRPGFAQRSAAVRVVTGGA
jgi:CheY-like chemotaxis protein